MTDRLDVLACGAHPDDAEIACGGTILGLVAQGKKVVIADLTRGENGTRGTQQQRDLECAAATELLGVHDRINLGLPDTAVRDNDEALAVVIGAIRCHRPKLLLAPLTKDAHPDHEGTGLVARRAFFHSGLKNVMPELGEAFRPSQLICYMSNDAIEPTFCVDISDRVEAKRKVVERYGSQVGGADRKHFLRGLDPLERTETRDRYFGSMTGCSAAEPYWIDGPFRLGDLDTFLS